MQLHELDASGLLDALARRQTSSVEVVRALIARRHAVDPEVGAFIAELDSEALAAAAAADTVRAGSRQPSELGLLHGLPLTIKDNIEVTGTDSTLGLPARRGRPAQQDAVVVRCLREAGAIVLGKTNVSQLLLVQESDNEIFGTTKNPWNLSRTPGGSSGGEGAALASGQSPLGIGSDIGGSIRIPAHFCGVCGLKPTLDRWSVRGLLGGLQGQELVRPMIGPMARSVRDLALVLRAVDPLRQSQLDPAVAPLPVGTPPSLSGLRIGCFTDDGFLTPAPAIQRAVRAAAAALRRAGATVVDYQPPSAAELVFVWFAGVSSDGGRTLLAALEGAKVCKQLKPTLLMAKLPGPARQLAAALLERGGEQKLAALIRSIGEKPVDALWQLTQQRTMLRQAEFDAWNRAELDAVICPPHVLPAPLLGTTGDLTLTLNYMIRYVMLNFPAGVVPVTRVGASETSWPGPADLLGKRLAASLRGALGLPVGVQVVARPYREEVALAVMAAIEAEVQQASDYPKTPISPQRG
jgi:fatty acid amide hydrolase